MDQSSITQPVSRTNWIRILLGLVFLACIHAYKIKQSWHEIPEQPASPISQPLSSIIPTIPPLTQSTISSINWPITQKSTTTAANSHWLELTIKSGDTLASLFNKAGLSSKTLQLMLHDNPHAKLLTRIKPGQTIRLLVNQHQLDELILPMANEESLSIKRANTHYETTYHTKALREENQLITATVKTSLYETAKQLHIPYPLIRQMTEVFHWEINFARDVHTGDQFTLLYQAYFIGDKLVKTGDILALSYTTRNKTYQAVRHQISANEIDYFSPDGSSLKQGFSRYPLEFSRISSLFSLSRVHPILHYRRPHQGIDLAAPTGTPVRATGDGRIEKINRETGFGNMIKISHQNTAYSSIYAHLLRFEKGLKRGNFVKRGQIIGYVGQTGLADGPHCHYEFHVNHTPRNPLTVNLPKSSPVPSKQLSTFKTKASQLLAQLKRYETAHLHSNQTRNKKV
jgi:murein DD-endopeptidase MepM/ murein hydrolase activator NlpD